MAREKGLGKGLSALFESEVEERKLSPEIYDGEKIQEISVKKIVSGKYQPRTIFDEKGIQELADSISEQGLMQPIIVRKKDNQFEIIAGERRWRAAQLAKLEGVPVIVREINDRSALAMSLIENMQREDLSPLEEANGIKRMIDEFGMTHEKAADALGKTRVYVSNLIRLLNLTSFVRNALMEKKIDMGHARAILALEPAQQIMLCEKIIKENLTVRQVEALVNDASQSAFKNPKRKVKSGRNNDYDLKNSEQEIADKLGFSVKIENKVNNSGNIKIHYRNLDELDVLISILKS
ncbi:MAG: ParB/RepB/Spo0J family partition protein [Nitrosomonadales bacterium]|jgi:ParB family chromosome partitioning protein